MSAPAAAKAAKVALVAACQSLWPQPVLVTYGPAGSYEAPDQVEILGLEFTEDAPRIGTLRRRWHKFTIDGRITIDRGGGAEVQQIATERALDMLDELAAYLQDSGVVGSGRNTLGGTVHWSRVSEFQLREEPDDVVEGRDAQVDFTVSGEVVA